MERDALREHVREALHHVEHALKECPAAAYPVLRSELEDARDCLLGALEVEGDSGDEAKGSAET